MEEDENPWSLLSQSEKLSKIRRMRREGVLDIHDVIDRYGNTLLMNAISNQQSEVLAYLIEKDADIDAVNLLRETPLFLSINSNNIDMVRLLLERGVNLDITTGSKQTPLQLAVINGNISIIQLLLEYDDVYTSIDATDISGQTALMIAASDGMTDIVELLLENRASVNIIDKDKESALMMALENGHVDIVRLLTQQGADCTVQNKDGMTVLMKAIEKEDRDMFEFLFSHIFTTNTVKKRILDRRNAYGYTALMLAVRTQNEGMIERLLIEGANPNKRRSSPYRETALMIAVEEGYKEIVVLLLKYGAQLNVKNTRGHTPLMIAIRHDEISIALCLIENGALVTPTNIQGETVLLMLLRKEYDYEKLYRAIIESDPRVLEIPDLQNETPLFVAIKRHNPMRNILLLEYNAPFNIPTHENMDNALMEAARYGYEDLVQAMLERSGVDSMFINLANYQGDTAIFIAARENRTQIVTLLLKYGADINIQNMDGETLLTIVTENNNTDLFKILVREGADINIPNDTPGETPLLCACRLGNMDIVQFLLSRHRRRKCRLSMELQNNDGDTALILATKEGYSDIVNTLLSFLSSTEEKSHRSKCINIQNTHGNTALIHAVRRNHLGMTTALLRHDAIDRSNDDGLTAFSLSLRPYIDSRITECLIRYHREIFLMEMTKIERDFNKSIQQMETFRERLLRIGNDNQRKRKFEETMDIDEIIESIHNLWERIRQRLNIVQKMCKARQRIEQTKQSEQINHRMIRYLEYIIQDNFATLDSLDKEKTKQLFKTQPLHYGSYVNEKTSSFVINLRTVVKHLNTILSMESSMIEKLKRRAIHRLKLSFLPKDIDSSILPYVNNVTEQERL